MIWRRLWGHPRVQFAARAAVAGVFIVAGAMKAMEPAAFAIDVGHYQLLPHFAAILASLYLPYLELFCGLALLLRRLERGAILLTGTMLAIFIAALASAWWRGLDIACGCFATEAGHGHYAIPLARDAALLAILCPLWKNAGRTSDGVEYA